MKHLSDKELAKALRDARDKMDEYAKELKARGYFVDITRELPLFIAEYPSCYNPDKTRITIHKSIIEQL